MYVTRPISSRLHIQNGKGLFYFFRETMCGGWEDECNASETTYNL